MGRDAVIEIIDNLIALDANLNAIVLDEIKNIEHIIIDMNTQDQLFERGVNRNDVPIADYKPYSPVTVGYKKLEGKPFKRVTLNEDGYYYEGYKLEFSSDEFLVKSDDEKAQWLRDKYGKEIEGLTDLNLSEINQVYIKDRLITELKKALKLI